MTETSFPLNDQPFPDEQWTDIVGQLGDGILDDWGGAYAVTVNTNDTVTINVSSSGLNRAVVGGFAHQQDARVTVAVPATTSRRNQYVGLLYDPSNATNPVLLKMLSAPAGGTVQLTGGQRFSPLVMFDRSAGQTLAAATLNLIRARRAPVIAVDTASALEAMDPLLYLRGTIAYCFQTDRFYVADGTSDAPEWRSATAPASIYDQDPRGNVKAAPGESTVIAFGVVTVGSSTPVTIAFTSQIVGGTTSTTWAGRLYITIDGVRQPGYRRVASNGQAGTYPVNADRTVHAVLSPGSRRVEAELSVENASSGSVTAINAQIQMWTA